jgi:sulfur carrier protein ThiS
MEVSVFIYIFKDNQIHKFRNTIHIERSLSFWELIEYVERVASFRVFYEDVSFAINNKMIPYSKLRETMVNNGDRITIVSPISGG